nr:unnamed protein product [Spirometra erinaceieuropaei]
MLQQQPQQQRQLKLMEALTVKLSNSSMGQSSAASGAIRDVPATAADIRRATEQDPVLRSAVTYVQTCLLTTALASDLHQLFLRRASLSVVDSCLMFADRVVISSSLRPVILRQFYAAHPVTSPMKSTARSFAYWPDIDSDIDVLH